MDTHDINLANYVNDSVTQYHKKRVYCTIDGSINNLKYRTLEQNEAISHEEQKQRLPLKPDSEFKLGGSVRLSQNVPLHRKGKFSEILSSEV